MHSLMTKTKQLLEEKLKQEGSTLATIAQESGISYYWLKSFSPPSGYKDPSVNKVQELYEYLSGKELQL